MLQTVSKPCDENRKKVCVKSLHSRAAPTVLHCRSWGYSMLVLPQSDAKLKHNRSIYNKFSIEKRLLEQMIVSEIESNYSVIPCKEPSTPPPRRLCEEICGPVKRFELKRHSIFPWQSHYQLGNNLLHPYEIAAEFRDETS
ncbi:MAG: hypothetical protein ABI416_12470 [Ginsengibacter sp.]